MTASQPPVAGIFERSWTLLTRNWIIIVPGLVVGLIVGALRAILAPAVVTSYGSGVAVTTYGHGFGSGLMLAILQLVGYVATVAYTTGMAGAAWQRGTATLTDGAQAFRLDAGHVVLALVGLIVLGIAAALLSLVTFGLALLVFVLFTLYTMPAAIIGARPGLTAIGDSFRIASARFGPTVLIALLLLVVYVLAGVLAALFRFTPLIGPLVSTCIQQAVFAFATLVVAGEYLTTLGAFPAAPPPGERTL